MCVSCVMQLHWGANRGCIYSPTNQGGHTGNIPAYKALSGLPFLISRSRMSFGTLGQVGISGLSPAKPGCSGTLLHPLTSEVACLFVCFSFRLFLRCSAHLFVGTPCWWTLHLPPFPPAYSLLPLALTQGGTSTAPAPSPGNRGCLGDEQVFPGGCCPLPWWQSCPQAQHRPTLRLHTMSIPTAGLQKNKLPWHAKKGHKMSSRE